MRRDEDLGEAIGRWIGMVVATAVITAILIAVQIIVMEAIRIYRANGTGGQPYAPILRYALIGLLLALAAAGWLLQTPQTGEIGLWVGSIGFLVWVVVIEWVDIRGRDGQEEQVESLNDVLDPWRFTQPKREPQLSD